MGQPKVSLKQNIGMNNKDNVERAFTHESVRGWGGASGVNMVIINYLYMCYIHSFTHIMMLFLSCCTQIYIFLLERL